MDAKDVAALVVELTQPYYTLQQAQLEAQLMAARELKRIADALELAVAPPPEPPAPVDCLHPAEARIDFGTTDGVPDWECGLCHFRSVPPADDAAAAAGKD